jgi:hypothetical protein
MRTTLPSQVDACASLTQAESPRTSRAAEGLSAAGPWEGTCGGWAGRGFGERAERFRHRWKRTGEAYWQFRERERHRNMRDLKGIPRQGPKKRTRSPFDGYSSGMGWDVAILLILGTSLALATLAWLLVGSLMNEQQSATPRPKPNEGLELRLQNTKLGR